jgi:hypothetical protein
LLVRIRIRWSRPATVNRYACTVPYRAESKRSVPKAKLVCAAFLASAGLPKCTIADVPPLVRPIQTVDSATVGQLTAFMREHRFAKPYYVREIVQTAGTNRIPASLLVCIEFLESSGGKQYDRETANRFGWDSGKASFRSHLAAIRFIALQLGSGHYYAGKSVAEKIRVYNPRPIYARRALGCMQEIGERGTLAAGIQ